MKGVCRIINEGRGSIWIVFPPNFKKHVLSTVSGTIYDNFQLYPPGYYLHDRQDACPATPGIQVQDCLVSHILIL